MRNWLPRLVIAGALGVILGLPLLYRPAARVGNDSVSLVIITPHNEQIRYEIGRAFQDWYRNKYDEEVDLDWRVIGGTGDVQRMLESQYVALAREGKENEGAGYDIVFGGGDYFFNKKLKPGVTVTMPDGSERQVSITQPIDLDPDLVNATFPESELAGRPLYDKDGHWWGVVLTSFGIVYNRDALELLNLEEPTSWRDLTTPELTGWVALVDPSHSGSIRVTYDAIMQRYGWADGWSTLRRAAANARYFASSSSQVPNDVASGQAAVGMSIDFYGRYQAQAVGGSRMAYFAPEGETIVNADPVAVLRGAPHREMAIRFVEFLLTPGGQIIWSMPKGSEGGPERYELRRSPIRRDVYEEYGDQFVDRQNPYDVPMRVPEGTPSYYDVLSPVLHAMAIDTHHELIRAWKAIHAEDDPAKRDEMLALFDALPFTPESLDESREKWEESEDHQLEDRREWTKFFLKNYRQIAAMR